MVKQGKGMNNTYNLSSGKTFSISDAYPQIDQDEKIGILFTGGVESYLVAHIAKELYGIDKIVFILITEGKFSNYSNNTQKLDKVKAIFYKNVAQLGGVHTQEIDQLYASNEFMYDYAKRIVKEKYPSVNRLLAGYGLLHQDQIQMLMDCEWDKGRTTNDGAVEFYKQNKNKYPELKIFIDECKGDLLYINEYYGFENVKYFFNNCICPFINFGKADVVELYKQMELMNELFLTVSCNNSISKGHCGVCKRCLFRKYGMRSNNIQDITVYD